MGKICEFGLAMRARLFIVDVNLNDCHNAFKLGRGERSKEAEPSATTQKEKKVEKNSKLI